MPYETYKLLHVIGLLLLFLGLGGALVGAGREGSQRSKLAVGLHGAGLLVMLVAGFGMQAKGDLGFDGWLIAKIGIWIVLALFPALVKRGVVPYAFAWIIAAALGGAAGWLALTRPF